ncbi:MAG TPA: ribose 5-phosphate isomerase B [Anaerolineales bacterium]|nr:ribose 5-phosphate isomerase B [Anaerolineales bacterium]
MTDIPDSELHEIVQRVLSQVLGSAKSEPVSTNPVPAQPQASGRRVVAIGADHGGFELKEALKADLKALGFDVQDVGTNSKDAVDYPDFAHAVAQAVGSGKAWRGIMIDGAGIGSCIVANKVPGVRAGMAYDYSSAVNSREHNDTNVLTLGAGLIGVSLAKQIVKTWLTTEFAGGRHTPRVDKIKSVEKKYLK